MLTFAGQIGTLVEASLFVSKCDTESFKVAYTATAARRPRAHDMLVEKLPRNVVGYAGILQVVDVTCQRRSFSFGRVVERGQVVSIPRFELVAR